MPLKAKPPLPSPVQEPARASASRALRLLVVGLALVGTALWLRSHPRLRDYLLRGKSRSELETTVQAQPKDALAAYHLAKSYYLERRFSEARDSYESAVRLDPTSSRAHLGLALTLYELGDLSRAQTEFEQTLRLDKQSAWAEYMLGKLAWTRGNVAEAVPYVRRATELDPRSDPAWYALGVCYIQLRRYDQAIPALQQALARQEASPRYHTALGELMVYRGKTEEGMRHYERALEINPDYGPACALMGKYYLRSSPGHSQLNRAEELLLRASRTETYHPEEVYLDLGQLYLEKAEYRKAVDALQQSLQLERRDERPYFILAKAYRGLGDKRAADQTMQRFKFISERHVQMMELEAKMGPPPGAAGDHLRLARIYRDLGLRQKAIAQYLVYLRLQPRATSISTELEQYVNRTPAEPNPDFAPQFPR